MHCFMPLFVRDLSICRFWNLQGILEPMPRRYQETTVVKFLGSKMLYMDF